MKYKIKGNSTKFIIFFTGKENNKFSVRYDFNIGPNISPLMKNGKDDKFMSEINKLMNKAFVNGKLAKTIENYKQNIDSECFINIIIKAYKTKVDSEAHVEVEEK